MKRILLTQHNINQVQYIVLGLSCAGLTLFRFMVTSHKLYAHADPRVCVSAAVYACNLVSGVGVRICMQCDRVCRWACVRVQVCMCVHTWTKGSILEVVFVGLSLYSSNGFMECPHVYVRTHVPVFCRYVYLKYSMWIHAHTQQGFSFFLSHFVSCL